jgi:thioredoxin-related protein
MLTVSFSVSEWHHNLVDAKQIARNQHKIILLNFSGSDWCGPCIQMHKQIFESPVFKQMADTTLVLVNVDFPRKKSNQLPTELQESNNAIAEQYNPKGNFPYTLLLSADGKVLREWNGYTKTTPEVFTLQVKIITDKFK